jgi:N-acetylglucosaminyldiphosphoundecaprenol N-acetyl-beta-D-mannosaminyltransferase
VSESPPHGVYWLLGLPIDAVDLAEATGLIRRTALAGSGLVFATPNLNFLRSAAGDPGFRDSVLESGLSLADGMPLVWLARLLGIPLRERVAGSTLFEHLRQQQNVDRPLRVFFFGGEPGIAELAMQRLNERAGGLCAVGCLSPGFGSIEQMSSPETIRGINDSGADFLVVALGAQKGQAWIEFNRRRLRPMVISHLGAVINFVAGSVARAPAAVQSLGLEWVWRLLQEPRLVSRYAGDARFLVRECVVAAVPLWWRNWRQRQGRNRRPDRRQADAPTILQFETVGEQLALRGALVEESVAFLFDRVREQRTEGSPIAAIRIDDLDFIDARGIGALYELRYRSSERLRINLQSPRSGVARLMHLHRATCLLEP